MVSNAVDRVNALLAGQRCEPWPLERLATSGREAKRRWLELRQAGHDVGFGGDAIRLLDPAFSIAPDLEKRIQSAFPWSNGHAVIRFLKWATRPKTEGAQNPFEPLIEIIEHGGSLHVEHGMFLDIYDSESRKCGIVLIR